MTYAVVDLTTNMLVEVLKDPPKHSPVGTQYAGKMICNLVYVNELPPDRFYDMVDETSIRDGDTFTITRQWHRWPQAAIKAEIAQEIDRRVETIFGGGRNRFRAMVLVMLDELNMQNDRLNAIQNAVVNATSLQELQETLKMSPPIQRRQPEDLKRALTAKLAAV